jgi:hypothetical protein
MTKIAGSGFISQMPGSADPDPDPHQNVMDPQHRLVPGTSTGFSWADILSRNRKPFFWGGGGGIFRGTS